VVWDPAGGLGLPDRLGATGASGTLDRKRWGSHVVAGNIMRGILSQSQHGVVSYATCYSAVFGMERLHAGEGMPPVWAVMR
jgi:hypothetical protein